MIMKSDCLSLLSEISTMGIDTKEMMVELVRANEPTVDVLKFINDNRPLEVTNFYEKIRKSYNNKKSKLYLNIMKEVEEPTDVLTTLSALLTQILLFSKDVENKPMFLRHARAEEISKVLTSYFKNYDITYSQKLLSLIKSDIKVLEYVNGREDK